MKKIMYIAALGILFLASAGHASAAWNTYPSDCPNPLSIGNYSTGQGIQDGSNGCWTRKSVSASAGQTINVAVYYDNTNSGDANNVSIDINQSPSGSMSSKNSSYSFSGNLSSSVGSLSLSQVTANLSSSETLTFSQAKWFKKGSSSGVSLPSGQTGYEAFNGDGLSMGTIAKDDWGTILFSFSVGTTVAPQLCKDTSASNYNGALPCTFPAQLCKDTSASNYNGALPCQYPPKVCAINNFTTNTSSITLGGFVTLSWNTSNCNFVYISNVGGVSLSSSKNVSPLMTTDYDLTATGSNGNFQKRTIRVNVNQPAQVCKDTSASNYNGTLPCKYPPQLCKDTSASNYGKAIPCTYPPQLCRDSGASNYLGSLPCTYPSRICEDHTASNFGGSLPCTYPPQLCKDPSASNYNGSLPCTYPPQLCKDTSASNYNGSLPCQYPPQLCKDPSASNYNGSLPCTYPPQLCRDSRASNYLGSLPCDYTVNKVCSITNFTTSDTSIEEGDSVTLRWNTDGCENVSISDIGDVADDGTEKVYPDTNITYKLTAYSFNGTEKTKTVKVNVDQNNNTNCSIDSFTTSDTSIQRGDSVTLRWRTIQCDNVSLTNIGEVNENDSEVIYPTATKTYTLTAYGKDNTKRTKTVRINVDDNNIDEDVYNSSVVTTIATNISQTAASLNGIVTSSNSSNANTYFEYGTSINLGQRTNSRTVNGNANFSEYVTGLSSNTIYYFRAVSDNSNGISRGAIEIFKTLGTTYVNNNNNNYSSTNTETIRQVIIQGTTVSGSASPIMLKIENRFEAIGRGDTIDYTVTYKNISNNMLTGSVLQVVVPQGITITNASKGTYSNDTHTLSVELNDLTPGEEGVLYVEGYVNSIPANQAKIVSTAVLVYTNSNGAQENAIAYVLNVPKNFNGNVLGASAFFSGFGGIGIIGWLLILILILLAVIIARSYSQRRDYVVELNSLKK